MESSFGPQQLVVPKFMSKGEEVQSMQVMPPDTVNPQLQDAQPQNALDFQADVQGEGGSILGHMAKKHNGGRRNHYSILRLNHWKWWHSLNWQSFPTFLLVNNPRSPTNLDGRSSENKLSSRMPTSRQHFFALLLVLGGSGKMEVMMEVIRMRHLDDSKRLHDEYEAEQHLMLLQHRAIGEVIQEMASFVMEDGGQECEMGLVRKLHQERSGLEARLKVMQAVEEEVQQEVLQTKTVSMQELRRDPDPWYEPFKDEYDIWFGTVIKPLNGEQTKQLINNSEKVERVPGKVVATIKPPFKRRGRIVACGNFAATTSDFETAASAIDTISVRTVLRTCSRPSMASQFNWYQKGVSSMRRVWKNQSAQLWSIHLNASEIYKWLRQMRHGKWLEHFTASVKALEIGGFTGTGCWRRKDGPLTTRSFYLKRPMNVISGNLSLKLLEKEL